MVLALNCSSTLSTDAIFTASSTDRSLKDLTYQPTATYDLINRQPVG